MSQNKSVAPAMSNNSSQIEIENVTSRFSATNFMFCSRSVVIIVAVLVGIGSCAIRQYIVEEGEWFLQRFSETQHSGQTLTKPTNPYGAAQKTLEVVTSCMLVYRPPWNYISGPEYFTADNKWQTSSFSFYKKWLHADDKQIILHLANGNKDYPLSDNNYEQTDNGYMIWELPSKRRCLVCKFQNYKDAREKIGTSLTSTVDEMDDRI